MKEELCLVGLIVILMVGGFVLIDYRDRTRSRCGARSPVGPHAYCDRAPRHDGDHAEIRIGLDYQWGPDE
jgi:hypothetical protein